MRETPGSPIILPKLMRIAELARQAPTMAFTSLNHAIDRDLLFDSYLRVRRNGAVGIDGQTAEQYEKNLSANLDDLLERAKSGTYFAPPVRRVHIPKGDGTKTRPIGIPTYEDKILQRAVATVLEAIYEQDFLDLSWGFRPGRSALVAVESTREEIYRLGQGGWILEVDIQGFFDALDHERLREILGQRVKDGVVLRLIGKWLNAGVLEDGAVKRSTEGTPQGGVISPILANIYLHEAFDTWFVGEVQPRMKGPSFATRYADDIVMGFSNEEDARRVLDVLHKRFAKYGLTLHPEKTRLVEFRRPKRGDGHRPRKDGERSSFDLLGFTLYWGKSRKGNWVIKQKTAGSRLTRAIKTTNQWCRDNRHRPIEIQHETLSRKMKGHYAYYGVVGNFACIKQFYEATKAVWRYWLDHRSNRAKMTWEKFARLLERYQLPAPRTVHSANVLQAKLLMTKSRMH
jgi:RNA-directed DNA polymerase